VASQLGSLRVGGARPLSISASENGVPAPDFLISEDKIVPEAQEAGWRGDRRKEILISSIILHHQRAYQENIDVIEW
jgi:hypothetical protein